VHDLAHGVREVGDLGGEFHDEAAVSDAARVDVVEPRLPEAHQAVEGAGRLGEEGLQARLVLLEVRFEQRDAEGFLRGEIVVEGAFRNAALVEQFLEAHATVSPLQDEGPADIQQVLTGLGSGC